MGGATLSTFSNEEDPCVGVRRHACRSLQNRGEALGLRSCVCEVGAACRHPGWSVWVSGDLRDTVTDEGSLNREGSVHAFEAKSAELA